MDSMSQAVGNSGPLPEIIWQGDKLKVRHYCPAVLSRVCTKLAEDALDRASQFKGRLKSAKEADTLRAIDGGEFEPGGARFNAVMSGPLANAYLLWGCLHEEQPDLDLEAVKAILREPTAKTELVLNQILPGFFTAVELAGTEPGVAQKLQEAWDQSKQSTDSSPGT